MAVKERKQKQIEDTLAKLNKQVMELDEDTDKEVILQICKSLEQLIDEYNEIT